MTNGLIGIFRYIVDAKVTTTRLRSQITAKRAFLVEYVK